jgi:NAD(P)-dependent dehydrogenase (short-subunit alcohol dehydrogenase family)
MPTQPQHVIVTGGASGIGAAVVDELLGRGHTVTVFDLREASDGRVATAIVDVTDEDAVRSAVSETAARAGTVTALVACHGIRGAYAPALEIDLGSVRRLYDVHVVGALGVCREVVRALAGAPASIVLVSSTTAYGGWANQADYGPAKAAVRQLAENLAIEWAPLGVRVNTVAPGHTRTPMVQELIDGGYDISAVEARMPLGRLGEPDEIAAMICALLLDAGFVTGQCLAVDGGWTTVGK